jgi:hypothetical protein
MQGGRLLLSMGNAEGADVGQGEALTFDFGN